MPSLTHLVSQNSSILPSNPTTGGTFRSSRFNNPVRIMPLPSSVSTPNTNRFSGIKIIVTAVTSSPAPNTSIPRLTGWRPSGRQNPERMMNVQQILCCQINAPVPWYHSHSIPAINTASQAAWYKIMLTSIIPRSVSSTDSLRRGAVSLSRKTPPYSVPKTNRGTVQTDSAPK